MNIQVIKKGTQVNPITIAGADYLEISAYGIIADVWDCKDHYEIPLINSNNHGSGMLDKFLQELKELLPRPVIFTTVINGGLAKHLVQNKIAFTK